MNRNQQAGKKPRNGSGEVPATVNEAALEDLQNLDREPVELDEDGLTDRPVVSQSIVIPPMKINMATFTVVGDSPLIMHNWDQKMIRMIEDKQQGVANESLEKRDPVAEYNAARYLDEQGRDCIPGRHFRKAIVNAARWVHGLTMTYANGAIFVKERLIPIENAKPVMRRDMMRIGAGKNKTATPRYRPEYIGWRATFTLLFDPSLSAEQVGNLLNRAGFHVGIAEDRPEFGRFHII